MAFIDSFRVGLEEFSDPYKQKRQEGTKESSNCCAGKLGACLDEKLIENLPAENSNKH
jgi:hypothetical protein